MILWILDMSPSHFVKIQEQKAPKKFKDRYSQTYKKWETKALHLPRKCRTLIQLFTSFSEDNPLNQTPIFGGWSPLIAESKMV